MTPMAPMAPMAPTTAKLRTIVVDDEELARRVLVEMLGEHADLLIVAECANGYEAVKAITSHRPDLLLLDIQMPKLSGFEVLDLVGADANPEAREPAVIFATAHDQHAIRAFEVHAVDYLLKPIAPERLAAALDRARARLARGEGTSVRSLARLGRREGVPSDRLLVREEERIHVLPSEKIDFVEAQDDAVVIHAAGTKHKKSETLADVEATLDPSRFVRIHRSFLLNLDRLARLELYAKDSRVAILTSGQRLPVSRAGYARLKELL